MHCAPGCPFFYGFSRNSESLAAVAFKCPLSIAMENLGGCGLGKTVRKQRTNLYRRPQNESQVVLDSRDISSISSSPPSDSLSNPSSCDNACYGSISRISNNNLSEAETAAKAGVEDGNSGNSCSSDQKDGQMVMDPSNEGNVITSRIKDPKISGTELCSNQFGPSGRVADGAGNDKKLKKVKLKVGGVTRTIHTSSIAESSSTKPFSPTDAPQPWQPKEYTGGHHSSYTGKAIGLRGIPWKDFSKSGIGIGRVDSLQNQVSGQIAPVKPFGVYDAAHKGKDVLKRHLSGETFSDEDDENDDDEIRYLEKLRFSKYTTGYSTGYEEDDEIGSRKHRKISNVLTETSCGLGADLSG